MLSTLKKYWGYEAFRPMQQEIITSALHGDDTLAILPTGGGKSICFQLPAMMKAGICLVVSPLIALMKDQVQNLKAKGILAQAIYSGMSFHEIDIALDNAIYGDYKFLYVSPERLRTKLFKARVAKMSINYLVVDEAHCISSWGYDFRPDYLQIAEIRDSLNCSWKESVPIIALTATATPIVASDIMEKLSFKRPLLLKSSFERPNLSYVFRESEDKLGQILKICNKVNGSGIIYAAKRKSVEDLASFLKSQGIDAASYHAGMEQDERNRIQEAWKSGQTRIIVSTNAFGMGIDKPDVRFVCHYNIPESIESYFQEAGRAGRDGKRAYAILVWNHYDITRLNQITQSAYPPLEYIKDIYQKVSIYLQIPYEGGEGMSYKFDVEEFAKKYNLNATQAYYAIKYIEGAGYWELTPEIEISSKIMFIVNRDELYRIQLKSEDLDTFIKVLLRMYPGLFTNYTDIDESKIARVGRYAVQAVKSKLIELSQKGVIKYVPKIKSPLLTYATERLTESNFFLSHSDYIAQIERHRSKINSMIELVRDNSNCRSQSLLKYFGQEESAPCGLCDVCLNKKREHDSRGEDYIAGLLKDCNGDKYAAALKLKECCDNENSYNYLLSLLRNY